MILMAFDMFECMSTIDQALALPEVSNLYSSKIVLRSTCSLNKL